MIGRIVGNMLVKPGQAPLFDSPSNYGLDYEDVSFQASDGTTLKGWLIKGAEDKVIVQSHFGTMCCRAGYTNQGKGMLKGYEQDIHFLNQAKYLNEAGYTVLMYDFRGHGESETGPKEMITWGPEEAKDVVAAVDYISNHPTYGNANIGLLSICMGQGASIEAFGNHQLGERKNIKTMISIQPLDFGCFVGAMGMPKFVSNSAENYLEKRTGLNYVESTWRPHVQSVNVPTLVIQNTNDGYFDRDFVEGVYNDLIVEKEMFWLDLPKLKNANQNRFHAYDWVGKNPDKILEWFGKYV